MDPELQEVLDSLRAMASRNASDEEIDAYVSKEGFKSIDEVFELYNLATQQQQPRAAQTQDELMQRFGSAENIVGSLRPFAGEVLQGALGYGGDELFPKTFAETAEARGEMSGLGRFGAQMLGITLGPLGRGAAAIGSRVLPTAGLGRTAATLGAVGAAEGGITGALDSESNDRLGGALRGAGLGLLGGTVFPAVGGGLGMMSRYAGTLMGRSDDPAIRLANALGRTDFSNVPIRPGRPFAEGLGMQGGAAVRTATRSLAPEDAVRVEQNVLGPRIANIPREIDEATAILKPGTSRGNRLGDEAATFAVLDQEVVSEPDILAAIRAVKNARGGQTALSNAGISGAGDVTWEQAMFLERQLRPPYANLDQMRAHQGLRDAMEGAGNAYSANQQAYRFGARAREVDQAVTASEDLLTNRVPNLPVTVRNRIRDLGPDGERFLESYRDVQRGAELNSEIEGGLRTAFAGPFRTGEDKATASVLAGIAYGLNNMFGASARTGIQGILGSDARSQRIARDIIRIMLEEDPGVARALLNEAGPRAEAMRRAAGGRMGILSSYGGIAGGLLGGR